MSMSRPDKRSSLKIRTSVLKRRRRIAKSLDRDSFSKNTRRCIRRNEATKVVPELSTDQKLKLTAESDLTNHFINANHYC